MKQYWIEYWMNRFLAKFKHWIESDRVSDIPKFTRFIWYNDTLLFSFKNGYNVCVDVVYVDNDSICSLFPLTLRTMFWDMGYRNLFIALAVSWVFIANPKRPMTNWQKWSANEWGPRFTDCTMFLLDHVWWLLVVLQLFFLFGIH